MRVEIIKHPYFDHKPVMVFDFKGEYAILAQMPEGDFELWFSGCDTTKPTKAQTFLDQCMNGQHTMNGSSFRSDFQECLNMLNE